MSCCEYHINCSDSRFSDWVLHMVRFRVWKKGIMGSSSEVDMLVLLLSCGTVARDRTCAR